MVGGIQQMNTWIIIDRELGISESNRITLMLRMWNTCKVQGCSCRANTDRIRSLICVPPTIQSSDVQKKGTSIECASATGEHQI